MTTTATTALGTAHTTAGGLRRRHVATTLATTLAMYGAGAAFMVEQVQGEHGAWAPISDLAALAFGLSLVPVISGVDADLAGSGRRAPGVRRTGLAAAAMIAGGSAWLLGAQSGLGPSGAGLAVQLAGKSTLGVWLGLTGLRQLRTRRVGRVIGGSAVVAGAGYVAGGVVAALQLFDSPLMALAYSATIGGFLTWLVGMLRAGTARA